MSMIAFVSCVSVKRDEPAPAADLYISTWFSKASRYAQRVAGEWYILSAKHGLVHPEDIVAPYEQTLNTMRKADREAWAKGVLNDIESISDPIDHLMFLAGTRYRENLVPGLRQRGHRIEIPLQGLGIGKQLQRLGELNREVEGV